MEIVYHPLVRGDVQEALMLAHRRKSQLQQERPVVTSVRQVEHSPVHSPSACPCHARDHNGLSFPLQPKNAAQNRL